MHTAKNVLSGTGRYPMSEKGGTGRYPMSEKAMNELSTNNNEWYGTFEPVTSKRWVERQWKI